MFRYRHWASSSRSRSVNGSVTAARAAQPNVVLCSPYVRARSTARLALEAAGIAADSHILQADERLREGSEFSIG